MGMFDTVEIDDEKSIQVKCFGPRERTYRIGDRVELVARNDFYEDVAEQIDPGTYQVALVGGFFLNVVDFHIESSDDVRRDDVALVDNRGFIIESVDGHTRLGYPSWLTSNVIPLFDPVAELIRLVEERSGKTPE